MTFSLKTLKQPQPNPVHSDSAEISIIDVGHGNCTLIVANCQAIVIDAGSGSVLLDTLERIGIKEISALFISHSDADHIGGISALLTSSQVTVRKLFANPDSAKASRKWRELRIAAHDAEKGRGLIVKTGVTRGLVETLGPWRVEVIAPSPTYALGGRRIIKKKNNSVDSNAMSVVIAISDSVGRRIVLLPGDLDTVGLENLENDGQSAKADFLVYPHHGGLPRGGDVAAFAGKLADLVRPSTIIFSNGRRKYRNPQPAVVQAFRTANPSVRLACTQLSQACAADIPQDDPLHLVERPSRGRGDRHCCAGTFLLSLKNGAISSLPAQDQHRSFIELTAATALCMNRTR